MIRLAAATALALLVATPALAQPTLRPTALVAGEFVTVGDLIDGAEGSASVALFRAPDPGETGDVPAAAVIEAARRAGLSGVAAHGVVEVAVTRASREIALPEIEAAILARAATDYGVDVDAVEVRLDAAVRALHLDADAKGMVEIERFAADRRTGRFDAMLRVGAAASVRISGAAFETVEVATLSRSFARGDVIARADIVTERLPKSEARDMAAPSEIAGLAARRALREGQPLRSGDLVRPQHVERGAFVTLVFAGSGLSLSLKAKALSAGAAGDLIPVQNIQSKRIVNGVVTGPSEVTVTAGPTALARR